MEQTKTDPGRKKKKPLRRCGIFFACLLILFLGRFDLYFQRIRVPKFLCLSFILCRIP